MAQTTSRNKQTLLTEFLSRISNRKLVGNLFDKIVENVSATVLVRRSKDITDGHALAVICNVLRKKRRSNPAVAKWLTSLLRYADPKVRSYAAEALGDLGVRSAAPKLHKLLQDMASPVYLKDNCAMALGLLKYRKAVNELHKGLDAQHRTVRSSSAFALGRIGSRASKQTLEKRLAIEDDPSVKSMIVEALTKFQK